MSASVMSLTVAGSSGFLMFMSNPFGVNGVWKLHCIHCGLLARSEHLSPEGSTPLARRNTWHIARLVRSAVIELLHVALLPPFWPVCAIRCAPGRGFLGAV